MDPLALSCLIEGQTNSILFDSICLAVKRRSESADGGQVDDGQTNSVLFHLLPSRLTLLNTGDDEGQEIKRTVHSLLDTPLSKRSDDDQEMENVASVRASSAVSLKRIKIQNPSLCYLKRPSMAWLESSKRSR